jgi:transcriptional regulator with XRE-family HTH domain
MADKDSRTSDGVNPLKAWRARMGWTQARAADELGLHLNSFKNLEGGKRSIGGSLRRLLDAIENRGRAKPAKRRDPAPAPAAGSEAMDAELIETGRRYAKTSAAHVTALLQGTLTADLQAEMMAAEREVHHIRAIKDRSYSEEAMAVFGAFIQISAAAERATLAALTARESGDAIAAAADMRNVTLRDVTPTLTRGGQGTSVNAAHSVVVVQNLRRAATGGPPPDADVPADPPADASLAALTQEDVEAIAVTWRWTRMSALLAEDLLDGRGDGRADAVEMLRKAFLAAREELLGRPRGLAREVIEAARLSNAIIYRLVTERRAAQEAASPAEGAVVALDRRNQTVSADVAYTVTSEGEGARQPIVILNAGQGIPVQVSKEEVEQFLRQAGQKPVDDKASNGPNKRGKR